MSNKESGGPAFPSKKQVFRAGYATADYVPVNGMTLRDYFAAKAMQAAVTAWNTKNTDCAACVASILANEAYEIADAMIEARNQ